MKQLSVLFLYFLLCYLPVWADDTISVTSENTDYQKGRKFDYFYLEALRLKENNKYNEAFNVFQYALNIDSTSSAVWIELSDYYLFLQQDSLAVDALQKAVKYSPDNFEYKISLANVNREMGNYPEAIRLYEELSAKNTNNPELNLYLGELYLKEGQIDKAIKSLDVLENNIGMSESLSMQKYNLYLSVEQNQQALEELEKLATKYPLESKYQTLIGDYYLRQKNPETALKYYEKAHKINPQDPRYVVSMANYYEYMVDMDAATREIENALKNPLLEVETKIVILERYINNLLQSKRNPETANALFETLLEQHSQVKELNLIYGRFLMPQNKLEEAKFQFQIVTESNPEEISAWQLLLSIALKEENFDEIVRICDEALIHFPDFPQFYLYKGTAFYQKKKFSESLAIFQDGIEHISTEETPLTSIFYGQIGDLYHQMDKKEDAYTAYDKALEYDENNVAVLNNYAYFLSLDKTDLDKAERMSGKCMKIQAKNPTYIDTYAWVLFQKENYSLAKFYIESAISNGGDKSPAILEHYGDILFKVGNPEKAVEQWEKALQLKESEKEEKIEETLNTEILKKKINDKSYYESEE
jgi:tetratricopeptide (TPR) repeat protein